MVNTKGQTYLFVVGRLHERLWLINKWYGHLSEGMNYDIQKRFSFII